MPTEKEIEEEARRQQRSPRFERDELRTLMTLCCGSPVPPGWIKVNDHWDPTSCGSPITLVYNICEYEQFSNKPVGVSMAVCASAPVPPGWVTVDIKWAPTLCGHPISLVKNIQIIKRIS